jgi:hypothetical protein
MQSGALGHVVTEVIVDLDGQVTCFKCARPVAAVLVGSHATLALAVTVVELIVAIVARL